MFSKDNRYDWRFYKEYIKSEAWQRKRKQALKYYGNKCVMCGAKKKAFNHLEVHHRHYRTFTQERMQDLTVLCNKCHTKLHKYVL